MRAIFFGTPGFAVPSLRAIASEHNVIAVFTQPDRPKGRGNKLVESPVKQAAAALGLRVLQPERIRRSPNPELIANMAPEIGVVVGYGQIIPQNIIDIPKHGILNVHASLLPKYRGAAPIQWAIANGEWRTGVTIMQIDGGLDTGDMLLAQAVNIEPDETAPELSERLAVIGAELLLKAIRQIEDGTVHREKQNNAEATHAPLLRKEDGLIDWRRPAQQIYNRLRGFTPWPGAYTSFRGKQLSITRAKPAEFADLAPGELRAFKKRLFAGCGEHTSLELLEVQPAGRSRMTAEAFLNGYSVGENEFLGSQS
jgi:methionyl-tRNA formyltransferase